MQRPDGLKVWASVLLGGLTAALPLVMFLAGALKLADWHAFARSLSTFTVIPESVRILAAIIVPGLEMIAVIMLVAGAPRLANLTALGLLGVFTMAVAVQTWRAEPPSCACFGLWQQYDDAVAASHILLVRNGALALVGMFGLGAACLRRCTAHPKIKASW